MVGINRQYFNVDKKGLMTAKISLDREYSSRMIAIIVAKDRGYPSLTGSTTVIVDLHDVNDNAPIFDELINYFEVEEEQKPGRYVGIISATDLDLGENRKLSYYIDTVRSGTKFVIESEGGVIKTNAVLDREKQEEHTIFIKAMDHGVPSLKGTTKAIIRIQDINDNLPFFIFPNENNETLDIPHSLKKDVTFAEIIARDNDTGLNGQLMFSLSSVNDTSPFSINLKTGGLYLHRKISTKDIGFYTLTVVAMDRGRKQQSSTQAPLFVDIFFDNSTLLATVNSAGPSKTVLTVIIALAAVLMLTIFIIILFFCFKRCDQKKNEGCRLPVSGETIHMMIMMLMMILFIFYIYYIYYKPCVQSSGATSL